MVKHLAGGESGGPFRRFLLGARREHLHGNSLPCTGVLQIDGDAHVAFATAHLAICGARLHEHSCFVDVRLSFECVDNPHQGCCKLSALDF